MSDGWNSVRVLVADRSQTAMADILEDNLRVPAAVSYMPGASLDCIASRIEHVDVLVGAEFTASMGEQARCLKLIQTPGIGVDRIDLNAVPPGVLVANVRHHERSIAEYVCMAVVSLSRRLLPGGDPVTSGSRIGNCWTSLPDTLRGKTVGFVGLGGIARESAAVLQGFGVRLVGVGRTSRQAEDYPLFAWVSDVSNLNRIFDEADVVVLAAPLTDATRGLMSWPEFDRMKRGAILINVARGELVNEDALFNALVTGIIGGAAIDVWWGKDNRGLRMGHSRPFETLDNVLLTPHISGHTQETYERRALAIAGNINALLLGGTVSGTIDVRS